jgi:uncharacterized protein YprB with RNaseH-like and TPR domain
VETVPQQAHFSDLSERMQHCWADKFEQLSKRMPEKYAESTPETSFENSAGIYSEFGRIICISVGLIYDKDEKQTLRITSFAGDDEKVLLNNFKSLLDSTYNTLDHTLCGHNIKEFDIPYICRRMIINGIALPKILNIAGKKPWEVQFLDTLELWKFGDVKNFTSLKLLTSILGIPTSKDDIDGSQVSTVYYEEQNLPRIVIYCQKDVVATVQVFLKINGMETIEEIEYI